MEVKKKLKPKQQRLNFAIFSLLILSFAVGLILFALDEHVEYFKTPSQLNQNAFEGKTIRLGGLVKDGSYKQINANNHEFEITDTDEDYPVKYTGFLPSLFREGQGVIATGKTEDGVFVAKQILAKHDENYMPPEVYKALKEKGYKK